MANNLHTSLSTVQLSDSDQYQRSPRPAVVSGAASTERQSPPPFDPEKAAKQHTAWLRSREVCSECNLIFQHWDARNAWDSQGPTLSHHNVVGLQASAQKCPICQLLLDSIDQAALGDVFLDPQAREVRGVVTVHAFRYNTNDAVYDIFLNFGDSGRLRNARARFECHRSDIPDEKVGFVSRSTDSESTWKLAKEWLKDCEQSTSHQNCRKQVMEATLPTRLVYVGYEDSQIRLSLAQDLPLETKYLTLSHCWGTKPFTTLTSHNMEDFLSKIPVECLTKTFKDAIAISRNLGFQYIWIDSMCIKQDDNDDWKHEATSIEQVYANSSLTIAAADSPDGDTGCFFDRTTSQVLGWKVQPNENLLETNTWDCTSYNWAGRRFDDNALGKRAWVYQERFLSPRILYLGAQEIAWECRSERASETFPGGFGVLFRTTPGCVTNGYEKRGDNENYQVKDWGDVIHSYTRGNLTYLTDKLVAISGVARFFASTYGITYLAGLWKEDLLPQMTWYIHHEGSRRRGNTDATRAPTWSWASTNSEVWASDSILHGSTELLASVKEVVVNASPNPFVDFKDGFVSITTNCFGRGSIVELPELVWDAKYGARVDDRDLSMSFVHLDDPDQETNEDFFFLPILIAEQEGFLPELLGLILQTNSFGEFRRVGAFRVFDHKNIGIFQSSLQDAASLEPHHYKGFAHMDKNHKPTYDIKII